MNCSFFYIKFMLIDIVNFMILGDFWNKGVGDNVLDM